MSNAGSHLLRAAWLAPTTSAIGFSPTRRWSDATQFARRAYGDAESIGEPSVINGLSLCSIHHRAFDQNLVGVTPDYDVRVHPRLLDDEDGPMLELLKGAHGKAIVVPRRASSRPDRALLAERFGRFQAA